MPVRFNNSIDQVAANHSRIAVSRGPLVYCAEGIDNGNPVQYLLFDKIPSEEEIQLKLVQKGILKNVISIEIPAKKHSDNYLIEKRIKLIPYYAWNNRGESSMIVWIPYSLDKK
jgi:DUF1680 family protein